MAIILENLFLIFYTILYVEFTHQNCLDEAILLSTHNIQFHDKKISINIVFLGYRKNFVGTHKNEFELSQVIEPSVFESSRFYCILLPPNMPTPTSLAQADLFHSSVSTSNWSTHVFVASHHWQTKLMLRETQVWQSLAWSQSVNRIRKQYST